MIKDIVVSLSLGAKDPAGEFAISVADAFKAHVTGLAFSYEPIIPGALLGGIPPEFIDTQRNEADNKARIAVSRFEASAKRAGVSAETLLQSASISGAADRLAHIARRFDLVIVGPIRWRRRPAGRGARRSGSIRIRKAGDRRALYPDGWS